MKVEAEWPSVVVNFLAASSLLFQEQSRDVGGEEGDGLAIRQAAARIVDLFALKLDRLLWLDAPNVVVEWVTPAWRCASVVRRGAAVVRLPEPPALDGATNDQNLGIHIAWRYGTHETVPRSVELSAERRGAPDGRPAEVLRFVHCGAAPSDAWRAFASSLPTLNALYQAFRAVLDARVAADAMRRRAEVASVLRALRRDAGGDLEALLRQALRALDMIPADRPAEYRDLAEELLVVVVQGITGTGWGVRPLQDFGRAHPSGRDPRLAVVERIEARYLPVGPGRPPEPAGGALLLDRLARTVRVLLDPRDGGPVAPLCEPAADGADATAALDLLPVWTRLHEMLRPLVDLRARHGAGAELAAVGEAWAHAFDASIGGGDAPGRLVRLLVAGATFREQGAPKGPAPAPAARHFLHLWLCWRVLAHVGRAPRLGSARLVAVLAELAYALRETLRAVCFAPIADRFFHQEAYFTAAVRRLVEYHAVELVGLPEEAGVGALLHQLSQPTGSTDDALGHLQHLFEVYLSGHFLLECEHPAGGSIADALADPETGPAQLARAFALAALFHDVGQGLHPEERLRRSSARRDGFAVAALGIEAELVATARAIAARYEGELREMPGCAFVAEALAEAGRTPGDLDHALRSTHFLLARRGIQQLLRGSAEGYQVVRDATRAILLHEHTGRIDANADPTASLLAFCNAVFDWDPGRALGTQPGEVGRAVHVMAAQVGLREPRDASLGIRGLRGEAQGSRFVAHLPAADDDRPWPEVQIRLQHPLRLDVMTWRIWLAHKRSIERLTEGRGGWRPGVSLRAPVSDVVRAYVPGGTRDLLLEVAERPECGELASLLRRWLAPRRAGEEAGPRLPEVGPLEVDAITIGARDEPPLFLGEPDASYRAFIAVLDGEVRRLLTPA